MFQKIHKEISGFTLIEILVVFSVIGLLTGLGFAGFVSYSRKQTVEQAAFDIKTGIEQAKQMAASRVKPATSAYPSTCSLESYRMRPCTTTNVSQTGFIKVNCSQSGNLYEVDPSCANGDTITYPLENNPPFFKTRGSTVRLRIPVNACGTDGIINFYVIGGEINVSKCRMVVSTSDSSNSKTICVNKGGDVNIRNGVAACP